MMYVIFAVLLVVSNLLTFRFTAKYIANYMAKAVMKDLESSSAEWKLATRRQNDRIRTNYSGRNKE